MLLLLFVCFALLYVKAFFITLTWVYYVIFEVIGKFGLNKTNMLLTPNTSCKIFLVNGSLFAGIITF